jgi:predicted outer membrane repeat protein
MKTAMGKQTCGCQPGNTQCIDDAVCAWGTEQLDCPMDPGFPNQMGCYGFAFIMPKDFAAPDLPVTPPASLFVPFTDNPYFQKENVTFTNNIVTKSGGACDCTTVPVQP